MKKYIYILTTILVACFFKVNVYAADGSIEYNLFSKTIKLKVNYQVSKAEFKCNDNSIKVFESPSGDTFSEKIDIGLIPQGANNCQLIAIKVGSNTAKVVANEYINNREPNDNSIPNACTSINGSCLTTDCSEEKNCKDAGCDWNGNSLGGGTCEPYIFAGSSNEHNGNNIYDASGETYDNCSVLGSFKTDLENILKAFKIFSVCFASVVTAYEYLSVVFMKNADDLKKANNRLIKRLCLIAALWLLPSLLNILLSLVDSGTCIS